MVVVFPKRVFLHLSPIYDGIIVLDLDTEKCTYHSFDTSSLVLRFASVTQLEREDNKKEKRKFGEDEVFVWMHHTTTSLYRYNIMTGKRMKSRCRFLRQPLFADCLHNSDLKVLDLWTQGPEPFAVHIRLRLHLDLWWLEVLLPGSERSMHQKVMSDYGYGYNVFIRATPWNTFIVVGQLNLRLYLREFECVSDASGRLKLNELKCLLIRNEQGVRGVCQGFFVLPSTQSDFIQAANLFHSLAVQSSFFEIHVLMDICFSYLAIRSV